MAATCAILAVGMAGRAYGGDDISDDLLDLLIAKGIVTPEEAAKMKAQAEARHANRNFIPVSKWKLSDGIKSVELFGDIRVRYEDRTAKDPSGGNIELERLRYALRFGLRGELFDGFNYGFRLETAANPRSPWVTFGTTSSSSPPYQGPFGKSTAGLNVGQLFIGWHQLDWVELTIGKMPNPLYTTPMVWDTDINPEGLAEKFKYTVGQADLFANFGQFIYEDTNPVRSPNAYVGIGAFPFTSSRLSFLLSEQVGFDYHVTKDFDVKAAAGLYSYTSRGANTVLNGNTQFPGFANVFVGQGSAKNTSGTPYNGYSGYPNGNFDGFTSDQTGINDLLVIEIPWEMNYKMKWSNLRLFGDYAQNLQGKQRAMNAFAAQSASSIDAAQITAPISSAQTGDVHAYQIGIGIGSTNQIFGPSQGLVYGSVARKHAWELRTYWQHIEQYALDPNLLDSDFFEGRGNLEGIYSAIAYGLTDNMIATLRYGYAHRINQNLGTGGSNQDIPQINPVQQFNILQFDLSMRF